MSVESLLRSRSSSLLSQDVETIFVGDQGPFVDGVPGFSTPLFSTQNVPIFIENAGGCLHGPWGGHKPLPPRHHMGARSEE